MGAGLRCLWHRGTNLETSVPGPASRGFRVGNGCVNSSGADEHGVTSRESLTISSEVLPTAAVADLRDRERTVLDELARAHGGRVAFQALRRRLGLHPQALTRTLRSLESGGWIQRDDLGYRTTAANLNTSDLPATAERVPVFAALLPPHLAPAQVVAKLRQRWFQGLRWFGVAETPSESVLTWTTDADGRPIRLRVSRNMIGVELDGREANDDLAHVAPLMQALAVLYGRTPASQGPLSGPAQ